ncbi:MAG: DUF1838 family protein [Dehalococcoidia bacterium]
MARVDLDDSATSLRSMMRARASLDSSAVVYWFKGYVYSFVPDERSRRLFGFEGFNIARAREVDGGYQLLTRESVFYKDPDTDQITGRWNNPWTGKEVEVVHVLNDPVNQSMQLNGPRGPFKASYIEMGDDVYFYSDIFLKYPSPLPRSKYPAYSISEDYEAAELFTFHVKRSDLDNESLVSVPTQVNWTRLAPWLPWMEMGDHPGTVVYHCRGKKLEGGYAQLPQDIQDYVAANHPEYQDAPTEFVQPNETSWTYFLKVLARRGQG